MREREQDLILIVEDDGDIQASLAATLRLAGFAVLQAYSGTEGERLLSEEPDLVLLDLMLPGLSGEALLPRLRARTQVPVIVMSGKVDLDSKVQALSLGADDYLCKPFERDELLARIQAALRRSGQYNRAAAEHGEKILEYGALRLKSGERQAFYAEQRLELTATEFALLELFLREPERAFSRDYLYRQVWQSDFVGDDNAVNVHISHLRSKLKKAAGHDLIETIWGFGYKLAEL